MARYQIAPNDSAALNGGITAVSRIQGSMELRLSKPTSWTRSAIETARNAARQAASARVIAGAIAQGTAHDSAGVASGPLWRISVQVKAWSGPSTASTTSSTVTEAGSMGPLCHISDIPLDGRHVMKLAVIGGTGLIGSQVVTKLNAAGHEAVPHSQSTGIDVISGQGLDKAVAVADVIVNLTNSPTFDEASPAFFQTSMDNLLAAGRKAGVRHFVVLSIVGVDQVPELDYYRAKALQEDILAGGPIPYSIVRATQFMEFIDAVLSWTADGDTVRLPATPIQPIAAKDVADAVAEVAAGAPLGGIRNIAGPEIFSLDELGRITLSHKSDGRTVVTDPTAGMFAAVKGDVLTDKDAHLAPTHYADWLS